MFGAGGQYGFFLHQELRAQNQQQPSEIVSLRSRMLSTGGEGGGRRETKLSAQGETTGSGIDPLSGSAGAGTRS